MIQPPKALGLFLCDHVIIDRDTLKPCLIGCFAGLAVSEFPSGPQRFDVFSMLTDGLGDVTIDLTATHLDTEEEVYMRRVPLRFPDPLQVVYFRYRVLDCDFPTPGVYLIALSVGDVEIDGLPRTRLSKGINMNADNPPSDPAPDEPTREPTPGDQHKGPKKKRRHILGLPPGYKFDPNAKPTRRT